MAVDYLKTLKGEELVRISADFDYLSATSEFVGLRLLPMVKTSNLKVALYNLMKGNEVRVSALVHAFDSEARIGDRPEYQELKAELFLIKEKIDQGEELRKKIKDFGMDSSERAIINAIYDDIANEISKVLVGFERRACELLSTGQLVINENGAVKTVTMGYNSSTNSIGFTGWNVASHDIIADLLALQKAAKNKIKRQIISSTVLGYILNNTKLNAIAANDPQQGYLTQDYALNYIERITGIEMIVDDRTYKLSYADNTEYRFFPEKTVISLTSRGAVGNTFMTSTPTEDANQTDASYGFVAVHQWVSDDPYTSWTKAEGVGLPVIPDINNVLYLSALTDSE